MFDLQKLKLNPGFRPVLQIPRKAPPRHSKGDRFLKGPIPWNWLVAAAEAPGRALHVAIAIWFEAGLTSNRQVRLSHARLRELGVDRHSARRGLNALEALKVISIDRRKGQSPVVVILEVERPRPPGSMLSDPIAT